MMTTDRPGGLLWVALTRRLAWMVLLAATLFSFGCGDDSRHSSSAAKYPTGISEDIEQQLKYDARVDSFEPGDADLIVNVNEAWLNSPPGMQERSVGQWYGMWHANRSGGVIVQYEGNKIASWTSLDGYKPETKAKTGESHSES